MTVKLNLLFLYLILAYTLIRAETKFVGSHLTQNRKLPPNRLQKFHDKKISKFCKLSKLEHGNGTQNDDGFCSSTPQGEIPKSTHMPSTLILEPHNGATLKAHRSFTVKIKTERLTLGNFADPFIQYNLFSQTLDSNGFILGHLHLAVQRLHNLNSPPDPNVLAFFEGLGDSGEKGILTAVVDKLPPGIYRICTISASFSHQPLVMPEAKRGSQDDCIRITLE
ncbi:8795_t:CDS:1 [Acaulospora morrowiae]|uniref:8795_t:CDS:1 n=1 Tax=Acaulospora morrowiae TaxID=94023 RepID=A0A9N9B4L7_9GLOM|nr:8795_t:CDS:1 [Acaulospora morrowiae]